ncbi:hypothetical protein BCL90_0335 [Pedobacter alluvionis]|uniref:Uncharacterized protein n=1 Tax=Pedobacter alluvionis TaxID=475253 RepID=A0A497YA70_9SPHI|nr:hypothetical protein BCL90_0335 [Pedobacter alluvionis]
MLQGACYPISCNNSFRSSSLPNPQLLLYPVAAYTHALSFDMHAPGIFFDVHFMEVSTKFKSVKVSFVVPFDSLLTKNKVYVLGN